VYSSCGGDGRIDHCKNEPCKIQYALMKAQKEEEKKRKAEQLVLNVQPGK
jgi:hypothetical protein